LTGATPEGQSLPLRNARAIIIPVRVPITTRTEPGAPRRPEPPAGSDGPAGGLAWDPPMIEVACGTCGKGFRVKDEYGGKRIKCPACAGTIAVPESPLVSPIDTSEPGPSSAATQTNPMPPPVASEPVKEPWPGAVMMVKPAKPGGGAREFIKFTGGVLLVMMGVGLFRGIVDIFSPLLLPNSHDERLRERQFCVVEDFMAPNIFGPTTCYVYDREYQNKPTALDSSSHLFQAEVNRDTLVMVEYDSNPSKMVKNKHGIEFDHRPVAVYFISGQLSGRQGYVDRYKLSQRGFPRPD
jgi:hypothetical protein